MADSQNGEPQIGQAVTVDWAEDSAQAAATKEATDSLAKAQLDGAPSSIGGSGGLEEPEYNVNVKLANLQADPNNPLYSVKSFDDLHL